MWGFEEHPRLSDFATLFGESFCFQELAELVSVNAFVDSNASRDFSRVEIADEHLESVGFVRRW